MSEQNESAGGTALILPLEAERLTLDVGGGKAANLSRMARAGFRVPPAFVLTTAAYRRVVAGTPELEATIRATLERLDARDPAALEAASTTIRERFDQIPLPEEIAAAVREAYAALGRPPVGVRSSATAEDLPDLSFAGQQDTFLHVVGDLALDQAIRRCWSSLWSARAIGYRARNDIRHEDVALAVVVQKMVDSEVSGVLFTANPLTGRRGEIVIDATLGLGEALVAGLVEPDHYVVDAASGRITRRDLGRKAISIRPLPGGGTVTRDENAADRQALDDGAIRELARLATRVEQHYGGAPQDIEWALADDTLYLLQSRPITTLFPVPDALPADPPHLLFSFGAVQGLLDPITPLGQEAIATIFAGGGRLLGIDVTRDEQTLLRRAGERLWGDLTPLLGNALSRHLVLRALAAVEPRAGDALRELLDEGTFPPARRSLPSRTALSRLARLLRRLVPRLVGSFRHPERARADAQARIEALVEETRDRAARATTLGERLALFDEIIANAFPFAVPNVMGRAAGGLISLELLRRLHGTGGALSLTRGLPHNVTTEMDLALWESAREIGDDPEAARVLRETGAEPLGAAYLAGTLPPVAQAVVRRFLDRYGMRGLAEIDFGRARWRERPEMIFQTLKSYLEISDPSMAPDATFGRAEREAEAAIERLVDEARRGPLGPLRERLTRVLARRVRALAGLRESPKFAIIRLMGIVRDGLLASGAELVEAGVIERADDLMFLYRPELDALARGEERAWKTIVAERRARWERERARRQIPRLLLSDGRAIYEGAAIEETEGVIHGSPVSPGVVEGTVRVLFDPHSEPLTPGEILVCPGTDPSWTPLFLAAGGLVTEVGGMMTHGSVVAREYGIPAVVGVPNATTRLKSGDRVTLDGNVGRIVVVDA